MSYTAGSGLPRDRARLLVRDTDEANEIFSDAEWDDLLALENNNVRYAAATALDVIASNQVLILKVTRLMDLAVDGAKVADALRKQAQSLRDQADRAALDEEGAFAIAEQVFTPAGFRQRIWNEWLRSGGGA